MYHECKNSYSPKRYTNANKFIRTASGGTITIKERVENPLLAFARIVLSFNMSSFPAGRIV
jgi:hypothetical protein